MLPEESALFSVKFILELILGNSEESISKFTPILDSYEGTIANISVCDAIMQYPSISANYWKEIPKFVEQEFDIYGPTPDIE